MNNNKNIGLYKESESSFDKEERNNEKEECFSGFWRGSWTGFDTVASGFLNTISESAFLGVEKIRVSVDFEAGILSCWDFLKKDLLKSATLKNKGDR